MKLGIFSLWTDARNHELVYGEVDEQPRRASERPVLDLTLAPTPLPPRVDVVSPVLEPMQRSRRSVPPLAAADLESSETEAVTLASEELVGPKSSTRARREARSAPKGAAVTPNAVAPSEVAPSEVASSEVASSEVASRATTPNARPAKRSKRGAAKPRRRTADEISL